MEASDLLFFAPFVLAFFVIWGHLKRGFRKQQRLNQVWREFADLRGLQEQPAEHESTLAFHGKNQDMPFVLECVVEEGTPVQIGKLKLRRSDKIKTFTRMTVRLPDLPKGLRVYRETKWSKLGKIVGMQDLTTGDPAFDKSFMVKGKNVDEIVNYLTPVRRMTLLTFAAKVHGLELGDEGLVLFQPGQMESMETLDRYFFQLGSLASALVQS